MSDKNKAKNKFDEGVAAFVRREFLEAARIFSQVIEDDPDFALAYVSRGAAYTRLERYEDSLRDFAKAIEKRPEYARAYHLRGLAYEKIGESSKALEDFNQAIELDPEYGAAYYSRAAAHSKLGEEELAKEDIEMVTMLTEKNIGEFANENNIWRSRHLKLEAEGIADVMDR